jgi:hypothetical protein
MAVLLFKDRGWEVATAAWSAGSKDGTSIEICYQWALMGLASRATRPPMPALHSTSAWPIL